MSAITIQDLLNCASQTLTYCNYIPPPVLQYTISESEFMCDECIVPAYHLPEPILPTAVPVDTRLLTFEDTNTTPLCLRPPTKECRKRHREEQEDVASAHRASVTPSPNAPRRNEEWLSWINWDQME